MGVYKKFFWKVSCADIFNVGVIQIAVIFLQSLSYVGVEVFEGTKYYCLFLLLL